MFYYIDINTLSLQDDHIIIHSIYRHNNTIYFDFNNGLKVSIFNMKCISLAWNMIISVCFNMVLCSLASFNFLMFLVEQFNIPPIEIITSTCRYVR